MIFSTVFTSVGVFLASLVYYYRYALFGFLNRKYIYPHYFKDKVIVITGANSGLGEALSYVGVQLGAKVIMTGRNIMKLEASRQRLLQKIGGNVKHQPMVSLLDVSKLESIQRFVGEYLQLFEGQPPDILVNNAGISFRGDIVSTESSVDRMLMETNYFGPLQLIKAFLPLMIQNGQAQTHEYVIVNVNSLQGKLAIPFRSAYSASKHAFEAMTDCLRSEVSQYGIHVLGVYPSYINTNLSYNALNPDGTLYAKMDATTRNGMNPIYVAEKIYKALTSSYNGGRRLNELVLTEGGLKYRIALWIRYLMPDLYFDMIHRRAFSHYAAVLEN